MLRNSVPEDAAANPPGLEGMDNKDIQRMYVDIYKEQGAYIRHYEDIRFKLSQISLLISSALLGIVHAGPVDMDIRVAASLLVAFLGAFDVLFVLKYSERADRHAAIGRGFRQAASNLDQCTLKIEEIYEAASAAHQANSHIFSRIRARYFWVAIHACIGMFGIAAAIG